MAWFLILDPSAKQAVWRLPAGTDIAAAKQSLDRAMQNGKAVSFITEDKDDPRNQTRVWVNCATAPFATIMEQPEPTP